jgi:hypothetical protein
MNAKIQFSATIFFFLPKRKPLKYTAYKTGESGWQPKMNTLPHCTPLSNCSSLLHCLYYKELRCISWKVKCPFLAKDNVACIGNIRTCTGWSKSLCAPDDYRNVIYGYIPCNTTITVFQLVFIIIIIEINTSWKTVIVLLDGMCPYITFIITQNTTEMYRSNIKITIQSVTSNVQSFPRQSPDL